MKNWRCFTYVCLVTLLACDSGIDSGEGREFALYRLKDPGLTASQIWTQPLENLVLADSPLLATRDLKSYKWLTHEFTVNASIDSQLAILKRTLGPVGGIPFVVTVGAERIYLGAFWYPHSSIMPQVPYIDIILDAHRICKCPSVLVLEDKRNDDRIHHALKGAGILIE